jgi:hypothetical protein
VIKTGSQSTSQSFRDLVYILYPEVVETAGLAEARDMVPDWAVLETSLQVAGCCLTS